MKNKSSALILLYLLLSYVVIQFGWWAYLIYDLNVQLALQAADISEGPSTQLRQKLYMIIGEGMVFLSLLLIGAFYIRKFLHKEQRLARQERNFLLATTHELNSPIAAIKLNLQTLKRADMPKDKSEAMLNSGLTALQRLETLVANILMASRIDSGKLTLMKDTINLKDTLEKMAKRYEPLLMEAGCSLSIEADETAQIKGDQMAIESIWSNLLHNAIKYAAGSKLVARVSSQKGYLVMQFSDQGPGVTKDELKNIFQKFYRIENEETRSQKGTGLGLYLVRELVELHNGSIQAELNQPQGLRIIIEIPVSK